MKIQECIEKVKQSGITKLAAYVVVKCEDGSVMFGSGNDGAANVVSITRDVRHCMSDGV